MLEALSAEHAASAALAAADAESRRRYGVSEMQAFLRALGELEQRLQAGAGPRELVTHLRQAVDPVAAARAEAGAREALEKLAQRVRDGLVLAADVRLGDIAELLRDLREALDELPDLLPLLRAVHAGDPACAATLQWLDHEPAQLEALVADEALRRLVRENPLLASFGGAALAQAARAVAQGQRELLALNAHVVRATRHKQFAEHVRASSLSATMLDADGKAFKKQYATGRRELEHEFGKSMRHRSIRDLSDDETGIVINDLKPIWLMSPLSVSDTLPLSADLFDVVIFDEASQIPTEEAVPALSRARQVVVVGDEMQLPPTSFFTAGGAEGDDEIVVEEEGERIAINLDSDSLLNQAARNLPATLLAWHYRSRHESLISFSNAAFYDGRLVTIPDRALEQAEDEAPPLRSDREDAGIAGTDALLARPVSFHWLADGVYADRRNAPEAAYIARTVREMLRRETGLSLGIVAFSEAQQGAIESALDALAAEDADFAMRLEREYVREDDDQFNGLFIKNLENVQGDERDVIILSICYAPGPDGKMLMNFGPINQRGGEKRLNVIFSRARIGRRWCRRSSRGDHQRAQRWRGRAARIPAVRAGQRARPVRACPGRAWRAEPGRARRLHARGHAGQHPRRSGPGAARTRPPGVRRRWPLAIPLRPGHCRSVGTGLRAGNPARFAVGAGDGYRGTLCVSSRHPAQFRLAGAGHPRQGLARRSGRRAGPHRSHAGRWRGSRTRHGG